MQEMRLSQRAREMKEQMWATITQHPDQEAYTFRVSREDLGVASLVGATLCAEIWKPIEVVEHQEDDQKQQEELFL